MSDTAAPLPRTTSPRRQRFGSLAKRVGRRVTDGLGTAMPGAMRFVWNGGLRYLVTLAAFWLRHRRLPAFARTGYLNDMLFEVKVGRDNALLRSFTADKLLAKNYARGVLGYDLCVPTLAVLETPSQIADHAFRPGTIAKPTHMSERLVRMTTQGPTPAERLEMGVWLRRRYDGGTGEWLYQDHAPRIIVEPLIPFQGGAPHDFKFHCWQGRVTVIEHMTDRFSDLRSRFYTPDWRAVEMDTPGLSGRPPLFPRPKRLDEMLRAAERLAARFSYLRVDFYTDGEEGLYLGELTHINGDSRIQYLPVEAERWFLTEVPDERTTPVPERRMFRAGDTEGRA